MGANSSRNDAEMLSDEDGEFLYFLFRKKIIKIVHMYVCVNMCVSVY